MSIFVFFNQQKKSSGFTFYMQYFLFCFMHLHFFFFFFSYLFCAFFSDRAFYYHLHVKQKWLTPLRTIVGKRGNILYTISLLFLLLLLLLFVLPREHDFTERQYIWNGPFQWIVVILGSGNEFL